MNSIKLVMFLAWRNVLRYRKRTIQSFLILFCGAFCVMLIDAYMKGFAASSIERVVSQSGHLDVHAAGYMDSAEAMPMDLVIDDADGVMETMLSAAAAAASPGTEILLSPSALTGCMLSNGEISKPAAVLAAEPYARASSKGHVPGSGTGLGQSLGPSARPGQSHALRRPIGHRGRPLFPRSLRAGSPPRREIRGQARPCGRRFPHPSRKRRLRFLLHDGDEDHRRSPRGFAARGNRLRCGPSQLRPRFWPGGEGRRHIAVVRFGRRCETAGQQGRAGRRPVGHGRA